MSSQVKNSRNKKWVAWKASITAPAAVWPSVSTQRATHVRVRAAACCSSRVRTCCTGAVHEEAWKALCQALRLITAESDSLRERQVLRVVHRARRAAHVLLPRVRPRLTTAASVLLAAEGFSMTLQ